MREDLDPWELEDPLLVTIALETMKIVEQKLSHLIFEPEQAWLYNIDSEDQQVAGTIVFKDTCVEIWFCVALSDNKDNRIVLDYANPDRFGPDEVCAAIRQLERKVRKQLSSSTLADRLTRDINVQMQELLKRSLGE